MPIESEGNSRVPDRQLEEVNQVLMKKGLETQVRSTEVLTQKGREEDPLLEEARKVIEVGIVLEVDFGSNKEEVLERLMQIEAKEKQDFASKQRASTEVRKEGAAIHAAWFSQCCWGVFFSSFCYEYHQLKYQRSRKG